MKMLFVIILLSYFTFLIHDSHQNDQLDIFKLSFFDQSSYVIFLLDTFVFRAFSLKLQIIL